GAERAQRGRGVKRPRPHLHVIGLQDQASTVAPILMERQDHLLKRERRRGQDAYPWDWDGRSGAALADGSGAVKEALSHASRASILSGSLDSEANRRHCQGTLTDGQAKMTRASV